MVALKRRQPPGPTRLHGGSRNAVVALKPDFDAVKEAGRMRSRNAVVALKQCSFGEPERALARSRNAVVALKPSDQTLSALSDQTKQERRGGIETSSGWVSITIIRARKQERRGGIETKTEIRPTGEFSTKQERRGGIERHVSGGLNQNATVKQERRGGIESSHAVRADPVDPFEAGTPWWH